MNDLDPLAIATQGIGYSPLLVAVQGLWGVEDDKEPPHKLPTGYVSKRRRIDSDDDVLVFIL
jgi:hypothetical protein